MSIILSSYINIISRSFIRVTRVKFKMPLQVYIYTPYLPFSSLKPTYSSIQQIAFYNKNVISNDNTDICEDYDKSKAVIIAKLHFKSDEDSAPFYNLSIKSLLQIYKTTKKDVELGNCENRLYYLSKRLKCSPSILSKSVAKRTFIYNLSFDWLERSLNTLLEMGVSEDRILRDLWVLKYHNKTIEERLLRVKNLGVDNLYPWMVRCSENILNRSISISQETKTILGEIKSTKNYIATRLNTTPDAVEEMYFTTPALKRIRASKAKKFLDFLTDEGFDIEDIAKKPRVLCASQKTVMMRLEKLRKLGLKDINLNVLCRSRKDFKKYCESIESVSNAKE
ncbi:transcription termination factor, mitochondrial [Epargyreus clarus]|uniref:transcription termination factor, mitochondrial n=1 Tax=Epargyreus clarus TaxID=520877 RepID=UPI003C2BC32E